MRDQCSVTAMILGVMTTVSDCTSYTMVGCHGCVTSDMNVKYPSDIMKVILKVTIWMKL
jgi:hypothetical protein